jgi:divalent metal cation (Fe/Co/Zn/Cd) transporter
MLRITLLCKERKSTALTSGVDKLRLVRTIQDTAARISEVHTNYNILHRSPIVVKSHDCKFRTLGEGRTCATMHTIQPDDTVTRTQPVEYRAVKQLSHLFPGKPITTHLTEKQGIVLVG